MDKLNQQIRAELDRQSAALDAVTASSLNRARQQALAELERPPRWWLSGLSAPFRWGLAGVVTAALVMALVIPNSQPNPNGPAPGTLPGTVDQLADIELLVDDTALALIDNYEFYLWLDAQLADEQFSDPLTDPFDGPLDRSDLPNEPLG